MMTEIMYRLKQIYHLDDELDDLAVLLAFQPTSSDVVFDFFAKLPDGQLYGSSPYRFLYRPGTRVNRVLLVAHADTVWDGYRGSRNIRLDDNHVFRSGSPGLGLGADNRAGCAMVWALRNSGHSLLITDGEEKCSRGSSHLMDVYQEIANEINKHQFMISFDHVNGNEYKFYDVGSEDFRRYVEAQTGYRDAGRSSYTDICILSRDICGVNLSVGCRYDHLPCDELHVREWANTLHVVRKWLSSPVLPAFPRSGISKSA
ncbi:MAG: hypothetical protein ABRQ31_07375 [Smithellaceae bacterium]